IQSQKRITLTKMLADDPMQYKTDTKAPDIDPIISTILTDEPEYADLVEVFVERLPPTVLKAKQLFNEKNWPQFRKEIHDLKGMGGSYGFPMVTELAGEIGIQLRNDNAMAVQGLLQELEVISVRITEGMASYEQKCA
ncbi:MAG: Hpt domain-containing protein, partial [Gammaproteobacteria bacterium]